MNQGIEAILFDWGGVLIDNPAPGLMQHCARALGVSTELYIAVHNAHADAFQKGRVPEKMFWQRVCADLNCPEPAVGSLWGQAFRAVYCPKEEVFALARQLRADGYKTGLLSNTEVPAMEYFFEQHYDMFDASTFSCAEGVAKPERRIYEIAAGKLGLPCERCAFIDDSPVYANGASEAKMVGVPFSSVEQARQVLTALGVTIS